MKNWKMSVYAQDYSRFIEKVIKETDAELNLNQKFTKICVKVDNPLIILTPRPGYPHFFIVDLGIITVSNRHERTSSRHATKETWLDIYSISCQEMSITTPNSQITEHFDFNLEVDRPILTERQVLETGFDESYGVSGKCECLLFTFSQFEYMLLLKLFDMNLSYDDHMEGFINPDVQFYRSTERIPFQKVRFELDKIAILITEELEPVAELVIYGNELTIVRFSDNFLSLDLYSTTFQLYSATETHSESAPLAKLISDQVFPLHISDPGRLSTVVGRPINEEMSAPVLEIHLEKTWDSNKQVKVSLRHIGLYMNLAVLLELQNFFYHGVPEYKREKETPLDYLTKYRPTIEDVFGEAQDQWYAPKVEFTLEIAKPIIVFPANKGTRILVSQGDLYFSYYREHEEILAHSVGEFIESTRKEFRWTDLELFSVRLEELTGISYLSNAKKRKIVNPFNYEYKSVLESKGRTPVKYYLTHGSGPLQLILSFNDLTQFHESYLYQQDALKQRWQIIKLLELLQSPDHIDLQSVSDYPSIFTKNEKMRQSLKVQRYRVSGVVDQEADYHVSAPEPLHPEPDSAMLFIPCEIYYNIPELGIIMINDCAGAYSPLLSANFNLTKGQDIREAKNVDLIVDFDARVKYYNPFADCWEPLLEYFGCSILYKWSPNSTPQSQLVVSVREEIPMNINLSEAMLVHLYKVLNIWHSLDSASEKELIEQVSPFSIRNEFGSLVVIETSGEHQSPQVIDPGVTVPYQVELSGRRDFALATESLCVKLMKDDEEVENLTGINMKKVQCFAKEFRYKNNNYKLILDISLVETRKVLTIRSQVIFANETEVDVSLYFPYHSTELLGECKAGQSCPVPFLYINQIIGVLSAQSKATEPTPVDLNLLSLSENGHFIELSNYQFNLILLVHRHKENREKITVRILPPLRFRNLLPCAVLISLYSPQARFDTAKVNVAKGQMHNVHNFASSQEVHLSLRLKDLNESYPVLVACKSTKSRAKSVTLTDMEGNDLQLLLTYDDDGCKQISVHTAITILNYTALPLTFYHRKRAANQRVSLQDPNEPILCSPCTKLVTELNRQKSKVFKIGTVGAHNVISVRSEKDGNGDFSLYQFVYDVEVAWPKSDELLYTRVISISPRLIIVNLLKCYLIVVQGNVHRDPLILKPGDRSAFYWTAANMRELVQVRPVDNSVHYKRVGSEEDMQWDWSGQFAITNMGTTIVQCKDLHNSGKYFLIKAEVRLVEFSALAIFEEEEEKFSSYRIENNSKVVSLGIYQVGCQEDRRFLNIRSSTPIGWSDPLKPHHLGVEFYIGALDKLPVFHSKFLINLDKLNKPQFVKVSKTAELGHLLYLMLRNVGSTIVLEVNDIPYESLENVEDLPQSQVHILIPHLGFSIIESQWPSVKELVYIHFTGVECLIEKTERLRTFEIKVETLQMDNQYNSTPVYPVLVFQNQDRVRMKEVFTAVVSAYVDENPTVRSFKEVSMLLQSLSLRVESILVQKLVALYLRAVKELASANPEGVHVIFQPNTPDKLKSPVWLTQELSRSNMKYYIEKLNLCPVKLILSYTTLNEEQERADDELLAILSARGMLVMNVDSVPLCFYSFDVANAYANQRQILQALALHYKSQFKSELFKLIGYTDILGNPIGLFNNLGTGFIDLFYEPVQGMVQGPLEAGRGLIKGAGSFLRNSVSATFGTVSKLAGSVATGITALTQDKDVMLQRQQEKTAHTPKDVVEGIAFGVKSLALGFGRGLLGVFSEPYKGAKSAGFAGLIKGSLRGVSGLVVRPVAGVFDFTSKAAEGIMNTTNRLDRKQGKDRIRPPRVTYGLSHHIRPYNENDAEVVVYMTDLDPQKYQKMTFFYQDTMQDWEGEQVLLVLYLECFVAVYILTRKIVWEMESDQVESVEKGAVRNGVVITRKPGNTKASQRRQQFLATFSEPYLQEKMLKKLKTAYLSSEMS